MHSFLIDECLSPALVTLAQERGSLAVHVAHVGLAGAKDRSLMPFIRQGSHTLVTNNRIDSRLLHCRRNSAALCSFRVINIVMAAPPLIQANHTTQLQAGPTHLRVNAAGRFIRDLT